MSETLEYKSLRHFSDINVPQGICILRCFVIVVLCVFLVSHVSRVCASLPRCAHKWPYNPCAYAFVSFRFLRIFSEDSFTNGGKSNDASLRSVVN